MFYNNVFTWPYLHLNYFCCDFPHIFLQLKSQFIHKYINYSQIPSFFFWLLQKCVWKILCVTHPGKSRGEAGLFSHSMCPSSLRTAASDPLQPLRTARRLWISNCTASLSTDQLNLFHFMLTYPMKHVIGYAFCIISNRAQICIVNKSICHFNCLALSQLTGLRGQTKHNKWLRVLILSQGAKLNNLWAQSVLLSYELALPPE